jgi:hypothetical protein
MWNAYQSVAPQASKIRDLFQQRGEHLVNDHVAFRTFNHRRFDLGVFEENLRKHFNYRPIQSYNIAEKNLTAKHFENADNPTEQPLIFVSQFHVESMSTANRDIIEGMIDSIDRGYDPINDVKFCVRGRMWEPVSIADYESIQTESQYAAWLCAFGFIPNHFTVSVNHLHKYTTIKSVNNFLKKHGFRLNEAGGAIKGTDDIGLVQSSTMAAAVDAQFKDGVKQIPGAYYEFAQRFVLDDHDELFRGFVAGSANKIFESTDTIKE